MASIDPRFLAESGREIFTGNELLVKGALEAQGGVNLLTGYPGSPVAGFFDALSDISPLLQDHGVRAFQANNEALAVAAVNGSQMLPCRAIAAMKSVGVHVAADALALGNLAGVHTEGGAIIIMGEDPWCESTQVPADSRFICEHLRMAVVEPGDSQQLKDWIELGFRLSRASGLYIGYIVTVAQADGGGSVICRPNQFPQLNTQQRVTIDTAKVNLEKVLLPPRTWRQELAIPTRYAAAVKAARDLGINRIVPATGNGQLATGNSPLGFIVTGMSGPFLQQVLADVGLAGVFPILQMGLSFPADAQLVQEFSQLCRTMIVVEERRSFLERNIRDALARQVSREQADDVSSRLFGKTFPSGEGIPDARGLNPSVLAQKIIPLIQATQEIPEHLRNGRLRAELDRLRSLSKPKLQVVSDQIVPRTPTFCPGCPHRDSSAVLLDIRRNFQDPAYMLRQHGMGPVDLVAHGDTGCYTMLMFAPTEQLMHNYSGMGLGAGTGSGVDPFITNKQLVFMGDGTFFHSGQIAISNAIKAGQDLTFIILENKTTAMTGHQEHAGTELDLLGNRSYIQDIEEIVRGMAGTSPLTVVKLHPDDRTTYKSVLEKTILSDGVKVIIADKECGIVHRRKELRDERQIIKKHGYLPRKTHMNITPEVCENCLECTRQTSCPGLKTIDTDYGRKIDTDVTWCVNDGACERVRVSNDIATSVKPCPSFEQVTIIRKRRRRYTLPHMALDKLPDPKPLIELDANGGVWRCHMSGVGGMGIGVVSAILVRAGHNDGYRVLFTDRKGLAIRNGGVFSQITFVKPEPQTSDAVSAAAIPYGRADLLLGIDILEASRAIDPREQFRVASPQRTYAVFNTYKQATVYGLLGRQDFDVDKLRDEILANCRQNEWFAQNLSDICERRLGSKQFVNIMMLGVAYQLGLVPVTAHSIAWAIKDSIKRDHRRNLKAFNIGRKLALEPRVLPRRPEPETWEQLVTNKVRILRKARLRGRTWAMRYEKLVQFAMKQMRDLPEDAKYDVALGLYDLLQYADHRLAHRYVGHIRRLYKRDSHERSYAATVAAITNLAKVMLIKDEPYVAYLLTCYEKQQRDIMKFGIDVSNGDKIVYRHHTSPEFSLGRFRIRLRLRTSDWQLRLVSKMKWLRNLPGWHRREADFRDWYTALLDRVDLAGDTGYAQALQVLRCPEEVCGYREIRYPKMDAVRQRVEADLASLPAPAEAQRTAAVLAPVNQPSGA
jgi:indolepyruvate ferredoxin oxidoreductase